MIGVDFYPTLLDITGAPRPEGVILDGVSLAPLLREPAASLTREAIYWHFPCYPQGSGDPGGGPFRTTPAGAVRCGRWKLIEFFETGRVELYDTDRDVGEANDLSRARPEKTRELLALLRRWRKSVGAPVPTTPNPRYDPGARPRAPRRNRGERRGGKRGAKGRDRLH